MSGRRKVIVTVVICLGLFLFLLLAGMVRDPELMNRADTIEAGISHLADEIEIYEGNHERYPSSLVELESEKDSEQRARVNRILHDRFGNNYEYKLLTNRFVIIVTTPDRWFGKGKRIERAYKRR